MEGNLNDFMDLVARVQSSDPDTRFFFRGLERSDYELIPKIGRETHVNPDGYYNEKRIFDRFINQARPYLSSEPKNLWEWLVFAQHHGLPTRLLDWTSNPLVAF